MRRLAVWSFWIIVIISTPLTAATKIAFVTSVTGTGNLNSWSAANGKTGLEAADQICRTLAANADPPLPESPGPETFVAWLSDSNNDAYCRVFGLTGKKSTNCGQMQPPMGAGSWMRVDGQPFAGKIEKVINSGHIFTPLRITENNNELSFFFLRCVYSNVCIG